MFFNLYSISADHIVFSLPAVTRLHFSHLKKEKAALVNNYTPISILNTLSKIFEIIIREHVSN
jgi:hypothetical protein